MRLRPAGYQGPSLFTYTEAPLIKALQSPEVPVSIARSIEIGRRMVELQKAIPAKKQGGTDAGPGMKVHELTEGPKVDTPEHKLATARATRDYHWSMAMHHAGEANDHRNPMNVRQQHHKQAQVHDHNWTSADTEVRAHEGLGVKDTPQHHQEMIEHHATNPSTEKPGMGTPNPVSRSQFHARYSGAPSVSTARAGAQRTFDPATHIDMPIPEQYKETKGGVPIKKESKSTPETSLAGPTMQDRPKKLAKSMQMLTELQKLAA